VRNRLDDVERAFGRHLFDHRARLAIGAARQRAERLGGAAKMLSSTTALAYAADVFVALGVERPWRPEDASQVVDSLEQTLDMEQDDVRLHLLVTGLQAPQLTELPPSAVLEVELSLLVALGSAVEASVWVRDEARRPKCICAVGETATTRRFRSVARLTLEDGNSDGGAIVGVSIRRWQMPWGAVVARVRGRESVEAQLDELSTAMSAVIEREFLLQRSASRERSLVTASERRLSRLGFDLHDGALQEIASLSADVARLNTCAPAALSMEVRSVQQRLVELDGSLRELAHSLEPASLLRRPLEKVVEAEAAGLRTRAGVAVDVDVSGDFSTMTPSQRIALIRVLQESCSNIREHSGATRVAIIITGTRGSVELRVTDDGAGFEVARTLQDAAQRGRLGLVGSSERVRLLGGTFDIRSRTGGPTTIALTLPRWQPLVAEHEPALEFAY
jgi:signal transduction histidine kinase